MNHARRLTSGAMAQQRQQAKLYHVSKLFPSRVDLLHELKTIIAKQIHGDRLEKEEQWSHMLQDLFINEPASVAMQGNSYSLLNWLMSEAQHDPVLAGALEELVDKHSAPANNKREKEEIPRDK
jgi:hypothetical protein